MVSFELFARPAIGVMAGHDDTDLPLLTSPSARTRSAMHADGKTHFLRVEGRVGRDRALARPAGRRAGVAPADRHGSGRPPSPCRPTGRSSRPATRSRSSPSVAAGSAAMTTQLIDGFGRVHRDLRISVTDRCNFRCAVLHARGGHAVAEDRAEKLLTFEEIERVARIMVERYGVDGIRLTGGEPTGSGPAPAAGREARRPGCRPGDDHQRRVSAPGGRGTQDRPGSGGSTSRSTRCTAIASTSSPGATISIACSKGSTRPRTPPGSIR